MAKGIALQPQASDPFAGDHNTEHGLWVDLGGSMIYKRGDVNAPINISDAIISGAPSPSVRNLMYNDTGFVLAKGTPVSVGSDGNLSIIDVSDEDSSRSVLGVTEDLILNSASGYVVEAGVVSNLSTSLAFGQPIYVSKTGGLTDVKPSIGVNGFVSGDYIIQIGVISKSHDSSNKNLKVRINVVAKL